MKLTNCKHKIKKNYPFGKKSKADKFCTRCGKVISNKEISEQVKQRIKEKRR